MAIPARQLALLKEQIGVSRVARVTGLDRARGLEVACAVRPGGHVLQVSNGKGETWEEAEAGAVLEAAELWASETVEPATLVWGCARQLRSRFPGAEVWGADGVGSAGAALPGWNDGVRVAWRRGEELASGRDVWVPAQALHCPPAGSPALGPAVVRWTTNGMGAHPDRPSALRHALLEAAERDQLARALPDGWTTAAVVERMLSPRSLERAAPRTWARAAALAKDFEVYLFDLTPRPGLGLALAGALLFDRWKGPVPLTAGYACGTDADGALLGALLEAAQSRLTDIHGARDDVVHAPGPEIQALEALCGSVGGSNDAGDMPRMGLRRQIREIVRAVGCAAAFDLAPAGLQASVIKVVVPGMLVSELL
ncbi:MAG TPA: YcaO-like family protein [Myxococcales bacterium]